VTTGSNVDKDNIKGQESDGQDGTIKGVEMEVDHDGILSNA
jgi:hypothetical protein